MVSDGIERRSGADIHKGHNQIQTHDAVDADDSYLQNIHRLRL